MFLFNFSELFRKAVFLTGLFDLSRPGSRQREKVNLYSLFSHFSVVPKKIL